MADRIARRTGTLIGVLALVMGAAPVSASVHHHAPVRHHTAKRPAAETRHRAKPARHGSKPSHHHETSVAHRDAAPSGATRVPAGGIKLFCGARSNPLLIRKSTQGAGTTVTMVCR